MKQITFKQYKIIDITLLTILLFVFELLGTYASIHWFSLQALALSVTPLMLVIVLMRWGWPAAISAVAAGISYCIAGGGTWEQYIIYSLGNLFALLSLLLIKKWGKEKIRTDKFKLVTFTISTYLFICVGRWLVSLIFEPTFKTLLPFITTDIISLVIALVGALSLRNNDGMLEDQKAYLLRIERERREEEEAKHNPSPYTPEYDDYDDDGYGDDYDYEENTTEQSIGEQSGDSTAPDEQESPSPDGQNEKNI